MALLRRFKPPENLNDFSSNYILWWLENALYCKFVDLISLSNYKKRKSISFRAMFGDPKEVPAIN